MRALLPVLIFCCACQSQGGTPDAAVPKAAPARTPQINDEDFQMPPMPHRRVTLSGADGKKLVVDAEIARTPAQRTRGLMWRKVLPEGTGMFFVFEAEDFQTFWMKNTLIPLDLIFIRSDLTIAGIIENAEPKSLASRGLGTVRTQFVLEVPGGWSRRVGVKPGSKVEVEDLAALLAP